MLFSELERPSRIHLPFRWRLAPLAAAFAVTVPVALVAGTDFNLLQAYAAWPAAQLGQHRAEWSAQLDIRSPADEATTRVARCELEALDETARVGTPPGERLVEQTRNRHQRVQHQVIKLRVRFLQQVRHHRPPEIAHRAGGGHVDDVPVMLLLAFQQVAAKFQLPVQTTLEFTRVDPDPEFRKDPQLSAAAFKLMPQDPVSDPIQAGDGFYILHLAGIVEARPLTLEEAKPQIGDTVRNQHMRERLLAKGNEIVQQLQQAAATNQPLAAVVDKAGVKSEKLPPFSLVAETTNTAQEQKADSTDLMMVKNAVADLEPGGISDLFPLGNGAAVAILEKREPPEPAKYAEQKTAFEQRFLTNLRLIAFHEWLRDRARDAGLQTSRAQG